MTKGMLLRHARSTLDALDVEAVAKDEQLSWKTSPSSIGARD
jgi:hypothetical protein